MNTDFWRGVLCTVGFIVLVPLALKFISATYKNSRAWFKNLTLIGWVGMTLILLGQKMIGKRHWETMRYDNKLWLHLRFGPMQFKDDEIR